MGFVEYGLTVIEKMAEPFTCFDRFSQTTDNITENMKMQENVRNLSIF